MTIVDRLGHRWTRSVSLVAGRDGGHKLDYYLAGVIALVLETEAFTSGNRRGLLILNVLAVAVMALAAAWRRRAPLVFIIVVGAAALSLSRGLASASTGSGTLTDLYCIVLPTYTVAAWEKRGRAIVGFLVWVAFAIGVLAVQHVSGGNLAPAGVTALATWVAGRVMYSQRALTSELERKLALLTAERADRARLAVASERMRIARELHEVVAHIVVGMVLQAEAAQHLLDRDESRTDVILATIENTGRGALIEMRRILGVLRRPDHARNLEPQPGLGQIHALIQRGRDHGQRVGLRVVGNPGTLPAHIDFGIYRILEEALDSACSEPNAALSVTVNFDRDDIELRIDAESQNSISWPTPAMTERVAWCGGDLQVDTNGQVCHLRARLPGGLRGVTT